MERIKDLSKVVLRPDGLLAKIYEVKRSTIILPGAENSRESLDYLEVVTVGSGITDIEPGDYIMDMAPTDIAVYNIAGVKYGLLYKGNIRISIKPDNFDKDYKNNTSNLTI